MCPRPPYSHLHTTLSGLGAEGLEERARQCDACLDRHGITFTLGESERPLPMVRVPRLLTPVERKQIEAGVIQRLRAPEAFLNDIYAGDGSVGLGVSVEITQL